MFSNCEQFLVSLYYAFGMALLSKGSSEVSQFHTGLHTGTICASTKCGIGASQIKCEIWPRYDMGEEGEGGVSHSLYEI